jgi:DNA-binding transcriptional regulator YiaG
MTKQYRSEVMASIHETAEGLHAAGVMNKQTIRKFDEACLTLFGASGVSGNPPPPSVETRR